MVTSEKKDESFVQELIKTIALFDLWMKTAVFFKVIIEYTRPDRYTKCKNKWRITFKQSKANICKQCET